MPRVTKAKAAKTQSPTADTSTTKTAEALAAAISPPLSDCLITDSLKSDTLITDSLIADALTHQSTADTLATGRCDSPIHPLSGDVEMTQELVCPQQGDQEEEKTASSEGSQSEYDQLNAALLKFIDCNALKNCAQRSAEWYRVRQFSFGGSEISNLMSICKKRYMTQQQFLQEKYSAQNGTGKGIDPKKQLIMDWGTFFEPVHRDAIEDLMKIKVYETSMCPAKGILLGSHQSPDGLAVVRTQDFLQHVSCHDIVNREVFKKEYLTILIEQKCPYYRKPMKEQVPDHYIGQIKLGLNVFTPCDLGCFSDSLIRVCTSKQFFNKAYNQGILRQARPEMPDPEPVYVGMIEFSPASQQLLSLTPGDVSAEFTDSKFAQMMDLLRGGKLQTTSHLFRYSPEVKQPVYDLAKQLQRDGKSFLCWKMVGLTFTAVERSRGFDSVLSIFISLGKKVLAKYNEQQELPAKEMAEMQAFSVFIQKLAMPLTAGNHQDAWFRKHQQAIISKFEECFTDDWQSFYVLLSLMIGANDSQLTDRANTYILRARELCKDDEIKTILLEQLIQELQVTV